jgi:hypothetical protein
MKNKGMKIKHPKMRGEWAELRFMARAAEQGLQVSKPWGDSASYDFVVEHEARCLRVQVKSTMHRRHGGHCCQVRGSQRRAYVDNSFDFAAVYLIPEDVWYIIPTEHIAGQTSLFFSPKLRNSKYGQYKEAWHLLRGAERIGRIEACAEEMIFNTEAGSHGAASSLW